MNASPAQKPAGFTLVELIIGMTLSLMVMGAILSSYIFLARNFTRSLGFGSAHQATLESQGRKTLTYFEQDTRMASGIISTPPALPDTFSNTVKLTVPTAGIPEIILYYYNSSASSIYLHANDAIDSTFDGAGVEFLPGTLTRVVMDTPRIYQVLHHNLLTCTFNYYDSSPTTSGNAVGNSYSNAALASGNYISGVKQISVTFSSQSGDSTNGSLTQLYQVTSPRMILRNKQLMP